MRLDHWLEAQGLTPYAFAPRISATGETVRRYAKRLRVPNPKQMVLIAKETGFEVMPNDFYDLGLPLPDNKQKAEHGNVKQTQRVRE